MIFIDGTDDDGNLDSDLEKGVHAPFAVFDSDRQDWLVVGFRWVWQARLWCFLRGLHPQN